MGCSGPRCRSRFPALSPGGRGVPATRRKGGGEGVGEGTRWGNAGPGRGPTGVPPCQGTPLPSLAAYDSWCGVAHGCTRKIGLKICGKSARGTPHPELRHASDRAPLGHAPLRPGTGRTTSGSPWRAHGSSAPRPGRAPGCPGAGGTAAAPSPLLWPPGCGERAGLGRLSV